MTPPFDPASSCSATCAATQRSQYCELCEHILLCMRNQKLIVINIGHPSHQTQLLQ